MAMNRTKFIRNASSGNSGAPVMHSYNGSPVATGGSNDSLIVITALGYFNPVTDSLKVGDFIFCLNSDFVPGAPGAAMAMTVQVLTVGANNVTVRTVSTAA